MVRPRLCASVSDFVFAYQEYKNQLSVIIGKITDGRKYSNLIQNKNTYRLDIENKYIQIMKKIYNFLYIFYKSTHKSSSPVLTKQFPKLKKKKKTRLQIWNTSSHTAWHIKQLIECNIIYTKINKFRYLLIIKIIVQKLLSKIQI